MVKVEGAGFQSLERTDCQVPGFWYSLPRAMKIQTGTSEAVSLCL